MKLLKCSFVKLFHKKYWYKNSLLMQLFLEYVICDHRNKV